MALLTYLVPPLFAWGLWFVIRLLGGHPVLDYGTFGVAAVVTAFVALVAVIDANMAGR